MTWRVPRRYCSRPLRRRTRGVRVLPNAAAIAAWCQSITGRIDGGDAAGALGEIDGRLAADAHAFYARWLRGYALTQLGDLEGGTKELEQALAENPFPDRCSRSYRDELARVAAKAGVAFIDTQALFRAKSGRGIALISRERFT